MHSIWFALARFKFHFTITFTWLRRFVVNKRLIKSWSGLTKHMQVSPRVCVVNYHSHNVYSTYNDIALISNMHLFYIYINMQIVSSQRHRHQFATI